MSHGDEKGKLFVGGLSWDTTHASLLGYFSRFGEVSDCVVVINPSTGKSRGFGFVNFKDPCCVDTVLAAGPHILDGKQIDPNGCNRKKLNKTGGKESNRKKLFVGGLPPNVDEQQLRDGFSKYGKVNDVVIVYDQHKQKPRGFGFLTFEDEESVERIVQERFVLISGKQVECKRAEPKDASARLLTDSASAAMVLAQAPDGTVALVPAHALNTAASGQNIYSQTASVCPTDLASYRAAMSQELSSVMQPGMRFMPNAPSSVQHGPSYIMMGAGGSPFGAGGYVLVNSPAAAAGGGNMLMPPVPAGSTGVFFPPRGGLATNNMLFQGVPGPGSGFVLSAGPSGSLMPSAVPQYYMGYTQMPSSSELSATYATNGPSFGVQMPSAAAAAAVYAVGKPEQSTGLLPAASDTDMSSSLGTQLATPYTFGLVEAADDSCVRPSTTNACDTASARLSAPASSLGYYFIPGYQPQITGSYTAAGGNAIYASSVAGDQTAAYLAQSSVFGRLASATNTTGHSYHPYRR
jgi:RNA-binding protein Musashi